MDRPVGLYDRDREWADLARFVTAPNDGPRLGVVYGRRRQGKSYLLRAIAAQSDGLYYQALEEERAPALSRIGRLVANDAGITGGSVVYEDWSAAVRGLIDRAGARRPIILDEFPYLLAQSAELPSVIQAAFDDSRSGQAPSFKLLLCGSALSVMSDLPSGQKALRGRAILDLALRPFDFRQAAEFWGITDPETAFLVHAVVGGTPGYRTLLDAQTPSGAGNFFEWLSATVLNPSHAMFREADYLLTEDPAISRRALYQSVLAAIAEGHSTRSAVGRLLRRDDSALRHPLLVLERAGFIRRDEDLWLAKRPLLRIDDPYLRFYFAVVRPNIARFEALETAEVWSEVQSTFVSNVLGPHFEQLARVWTERFASPVTLGGRPSRVGFTQLNDALARSRVELDVVAIAGNLNAKRPRVLAIGEAKGGAALSTVADLRKLERGRALLGERAEVSRAKLLLFSRAGFDRELTGIAATRRDVELVDLVRLYAGE